MKLYFIFSFLFEIFCICCFAVITRVKTVLWKSKERGTTTAYSFALVVIFKYILFYYGNLIQNETLQKHFQTQHYAEWCRTLRITLLYGLRQWCADRPWVSAVVDAKCHLAHGQVMPRTPGCMRCGCLVLWEDVAYFANSKGLTCSDLVNFQEDGSGSSRQVYWANNFLGNLMRAVLQIARCVEAEDQDSFEPQCPIQVLGGQQLYFLLVANFWLF